jgi:hypothetical protein
MSLLNSRFQCPNLFPYIRIGRASSDYIAFICIEKHRPVAIPDILDGVYP